MGSLHPFPRLGTLWISGIDFCDVDWDTLHKALLLREKHGLPLGVSQYNRYNIPREPVGLMRAVGERISQDIPYYSNSLSRTEFMDSSY